MIGKILKTMRRKNNLSQEQISKLIGYARNTVSQYETETLQPDFATIEKIAPIFDTCNKKSHTRSHKS